MEWSNDYSVHIDEIDAQHKILFEAISELEKSLLDPDMKKRWSSIHYAIVKLNDYVRIHFAVEEALMRLMRYPDTLTHVSKHRDFETRLREVEQRSIAHDISEDEIVSYLRTWLNNHIKVDDHRYSDYFRSVMQLSAA